MIKSALKNWKKWTNYSVTNVNVQSSVNIDWRRAEKMHALFHPHPSPSNFTSIPGSPPIPAELPLHPHPSPHEIWAQIAGVEKCSMFRIFSTQYAVLCQSHNLNFSSLILNETGTQLVFAMVLQRFSSARTRQKWFLDMRLRESRNLYPSPRYSRDCCSHSRGSPTIYVSIHAVFPRFRRYSRHPRTGAGL